MKGCYFRLVFGGSEVEDAAAGIVGNVLSIECIDAKKPQNRIAGAFGAVLLMALCLGEVAFDGVEPFLAHSFVPVGIGVYAVR